MESVVAQRKEKDKVAGKTASKTASVFADSQSTSQREKEIAAGMPLFLQAKRQSGASSPSGIRLGAPSIQRQPGEEEEEALIQPKLTIGRPNDKYEQEADSVAEQVMRMPAEREEALSSVTPKVQRKSKASHPQSGVPGSVKRAIDSPGGGSPLTKSIRSRVEPVLGADLSNVKVHSDSQSQAAARDIQAKAFTHKNNIYLGEGRSRDDVGLIAHEATHTVQQGASAAGNLVQADSHEAGSLGSSSSASQSGPRSLNESLDVTQLDTTGLRAEVQAINAWLRANRGQSSEDHELLRRARRQLVIEAASRGIDLGQRPAPTPPDSLFSNLDLATLSETERRTEANRIRAWLEYSQQSSQANERLRGVLRRLYDLDRFQRSPPVLWGFATDSRRVYASVAAPGYTLRQIATYIYGRESRIDALLAANPGLSGGRLVPGTPIRFAEGVNRTKMANAALNAALREGTAMRTSAIPSAPDPDAGQIHVYRIGGRLVTESQLPGVLEGARVWVKRKLTYVRDMLQIGLEARDDHESGTNGLVRGISDWMGDVDLPSRMIWLLPKIRCQVALSLLSKLDDSPQAKANGISAATRVLQQVAEDLDRASNAWQVYINGTIEGASTTVSRLEFVRDVSFGVAAGLAGAVAAPAVFAAAGGGLLGTGAAVGGGTIVGAGTGASLEFTSSVAGEGLSMAVTPGDQSFSWDYVGHRTWEGAKSGAIQGGLGAAGALAAPGVSNVMANRMFGANAMNLATGGQRFAVNAVTAATIGAPSGAAGAAIENVDDLYRGDISAGEFGSRIGWGGVFGGVSGAATSWIPINGLYRSGGRVFRGEVVTPRWMMEGIGFNPHQVSSDFTPTLNPFAMRRALASRYSWNPQGGTFAAFNALPVDQLPPLEAGHRWVRLNGEWHPLATTGRFGDPLSLRVQGDAFNVLSGSRGGPQRLLMSRAQTRNPTFSSGRGDQGVRVFSETQPGGGTTPHTPGHNVDLADTPNAPYGATGELPVDPAITNLHQDPYNFTPEPRSSTAGNRSVSDWGQYLRNALVNKHIRPTGGGYRQYNAPSSSGRVATGTGRTGSVSTPVPDHVVFAQTDANGVLVDAWRIPFTQTPPTARTLVTMTGPNSPYRLSLGQVPVALQGNVLPIYLAVGGPAGATQNQ